MYEVSGVSFQVLGGTFQNGDFSSRLFHGNAGTFRCGVDGEHQLLGQRALSENLDRMTPTNESAATEGPNIIGSGFQSLLETLHIEHGEDRAARISESPQLRLPTEERRLPPLEAEAAPLPCPRVLPLRPAAGGLPSSSAYAAADATAALP